jgi:hypothetical protein
LKKKISFRKKEVVEGADLYSDRAKPRKGRKGGKPKAAPMAQKTQITRPRPSSGGSGSMTPSCCPTWPNAWESRPAT